MIRSCEYDAMTPHDKPPAVDSENENLETHSGEVDPALLGCLQVLFRLASVTFADPRRLPYSTWRSILTDPVARDACAVLRETPQARSAEQGPCERSLDDVDLIPLLENIPPSPDAWNAEYESTFGLLVTGPAPMYECEYIPSRLDFQKSQTLADVAGFYGAFGLDLPDQPPERADHLTLELEFMACLLELERRAIESGKREPADVCRKARTRFFREHLGWWAPGFAHLLTERREESPFYARAGQFLAALLTAQRTLLGMQPSTRIARPHDPADDSSPCDDCLAARLT